MGNACSIYDARFPFKHIGAMSDDEREARMAAFLRRTPRSLGGGNDRNRVAMHSHCNHRKANREPNGCELIWLAAVNARLTETAPPATPLP